MISQTRREIFKLLGGAVAALLLPWSKSAAALPALPTVAPPADKEDDEADLTERLYEDPPYAEPAALPEWDTSRPEHLPPATGVTLASDRAKLAKGGEIYTRLFIQSRATPEMPRIPGIFVIEIAFHQPFQEAWSYEAHFNKEAEMRTAFIRLNRLRQSSWGITEETDDWLQHLQGIIYTRIRHDHPASHVLMQLNATYAKMDAEYKEYKTREFARAYGAGVKVVS